MSQYLEIRWDSLEAIGFESFSLEQWLRLATEQRATSHSYTGHYEITKLD